MSCWNDGTGLPDKLMCQESSGQQILALAKHRSLLRAPISSCFRFGGLFCDSDSLRNLTGFIESFNRISCNNISEDM